MSDSDSDSWQHDPLCYDPSEDEQVFGYEMIGYAKEKKRTLEETDKKLAELHEERAKKVRKVEKAQKLVQDLKTSQEKPFLWAIEETGTGKGELEKGKKEISGFFTTQERAQKILKRFQKANRGGLKDLKFAIIQIPLENVPPLALLNIDHDCYF